ncbi:family 78 glycoside hydrolase catalytic domain [Kiritimatiella glycovorans]|uniref:Alpha-L-rhamnosidase n=1 Tax=Kiritimatiella glycovorans TaxID=1307763 RepID=A0A0G3EJ08_9BACT|nr:family 78 glycoside hydrolase catalytic domain [Kiritimatiella glycovorans]AKJ64169.1 Alpha-L-rhamnosidase [Kiritimatiella glycovorans]
MKIQKTKRWLAAFAAVLMASSVGFADSYETPHRCGEWGANWIGRSAEQGFDEPFVYLRRAFELEAAPASAVLHISASRSYKLYVNGSFVGNGPARNVNPRYFYDSYEVASLLQPGDNVLAVAYETAGGYEGVIAQLEMRDGSGMIVQTLVTDESWKLAVAPWVDSGAYTAGHHPTEVFNARFEPAGWMSTPFNDSRWSAANLMGAGIQKPVVGPDKNVVLEPSLIPHYVRATLRPEKIEFVGEVTQFLGQTGLSAGIQMATEIPRPSRHTRIENAESLLDGSGGPAVAYPQYPYNDLRSFYTYWDNHDDVPELRDPTIILDFGTIRNAFISLDVEAPAGAVVDIAWGQMLIDGRVPTILYCRTKGADGEGKPNQLNAHRLYLNGRLDWESFNYQSFRYLQLTFRRLDGPLKLHGVEAVASGVPWKQRGAFRSSDPLLERFFKMSGNTVRAASYDAFMDNTIREKTIWGGDICEGSVGSCLPVYGDVPILRNYMTLFARRQDEQGQLPMSAFSGVPGAFSAHSYRTGYWMTEYAFWCNDSELYRKTFWPVVTRLLDHYEGEQDERGLLRQATGAQVWVDWSTLYMPGRSVPYDEKNFLSVPVNLLYCSLLKKAADVAEGFGETDQARKWRDNAERVGRAVYEDFWDEEAGLYLDGARNGYLCSSHSEHANLLALMHGLGGEGRRERILTALSDPERIGEISQSGAPFMFWPPEALFAIGEDQAALELMRDRYSRFLRMGIDTFCENWTWSCGANSWETRYRSLAQNGAGSPAYHMLTNVLGVRPTKPGFAEFEVRPQLGDLEWAEGVVPSPAGDIPVRWEKKGGALHLEITVPAGTRATAIAPSGERTSLPAGIHRVKMDMGE